MATYNLNDTVDEYFTLELRGEDKKSLEFQIKYPNTEEMRTIVHHANDLEEMLKEADGKTDEEKKALTEAIEAKAKDSEDALEALITPVGHEFKFSEVFSTQPINVQRKFREIIQKEFGS